ncbi:hypothetical protein [Streptomyces nodosus]|uniref:hypothetical protein n=1 Tax=Streptomyces nodosus TaxID=40318 RepID=UPI0038269488
MFWQWTGLALATLTLLPAGVALVTGRVPDRIRTRPASMRPVGRALLAIYAAAPLNAVPRLAGAPDSVTLAATAVGGMAAVAGCVLLAMATRTSASSTS